MKAGKFAGLRWLLVIVLALSLGLAMTTRVQAADFDDDGRIEADEVIDDDVFLFGDTVTVDGTVNGMLVTAGQTVTINGTINGDLIAAGETVLVGEDAQINGNIFGGARLIDVRGQVSGTLMGGAMELRLGDQTEIGRNLFFGGYSTALAGGSTVQRDAYLAGYQVQLDGKIGRNAVIDAAAVEINGDIGGNAQLDLGEVDDGTAYNMPIMMGYDLPAALDPGLRVSKNARIGGKLTYTSQSDYSAQIQSQPAGGLVYQTPVPNENHYDRTFPIVRRSAVGEHAIAAVRNLITLLVLGGLALWLIPALLKKIAAQAAAKPLPATGVGILSIIVTYVGALLVAALLFGVGILVSLISLGGLSNLVFGVGYSGLGLIVAVFTFLVATGSKVVASYMVGDLIFERLAPQAQGRKVWALVVGVVIYVILAALPFVGWVFAWIATFLGLGAIWFTWQNRKAVAVAEVPAV